MAKAKILVVEDEIVVAKAIQLALQRHGYDVPATVSSGAEAIQKTAEIQPDLILMDIVLKGGMDGIAVAEQICSRFDIPVVYLTAYTNGETIERAKTTEPFGYITKPFEEKQLFTIIEMALYKHKMDKALRKSESEKQLILSSLSELIVYQDKNLRIVWANRAAGEAAGRPTNQMVGHYCYEVWHGRREPCPGCPMAKSIETGEPQEGEITTPDGRIWYIRANPVRDEKGEVTGVVETALDITERKKAEEEMRLHSEIMKNINEGIYLIGLDDGIIKYANPEFEKMFGYNPGEMIGREVSMVNAPTDKTPKETKEQIVDVLVRTGEWHGEIKNIKKDGTHFWCYANVSLFDHPTFGKVIVSIHTDITQRKEAEDALRQSEERLQLSLAGSGVSFWEWFPKSDLIKFDERWERFLGFEPGEKVFDSQWWEKSIHPDSKLAFEKVANDYFEGRKSRYELEYRIKTKTGDWKWIWAAGECVEWDENKKPVRLLGTHKDITGRKQAEEKIVNLAKFPSEDRSPVLRVSSEGILLYANPASDSIISEWGCRAGEMIPDDWHNTVTEVLAGGEQKRVEYEHGKRTFAFLVVPVADAGYANLYGRDITERKKAERKLIDYQAQLRSLALESLRIEEAERRRLARAVHDNIGQELALAKMRLQSSMQSTMGPDAMAILDKVCKLLDKVMQDVHSLTFELSSPLLYEVGLVAAVEQWLAEEIRKKHGIKYKLAADVKSKAFDHELSATVFRVVRELLINVIKHAKAKNIRVGIKELKGALSVAIEDDGVGFDVAKFETALRKGKKTKFGLFSAKEQLEFLGGKFRIESVPKKGTKVSMTIPLKR